MNCKISKMLAYSMAIYTIASLYYIIRSRSVGTPFNDSLTEEQKRIKKESSEVRKQLFLEGCIAGIMILVLFQPFKSC